MHAVMQAQVAQREAEIQQLRSEVERVRGQLQTHQHDADATRQARAICLPCIMLLSQSLRFPMH